MSNPNFSNIRITEVGYGPGMSTPNAISPMLINSYSAMTVPAYWRAINFIAENLASFPLYVSLKTDGGSVDNHPLDAVLAVQPNGYQNTAVFWRTLYYHTAHVGRGFARVQRDRNGQTIALHHCLPDDVRPFRIIRDGEEFPEQWYAVQTPAGMLPISGSDMVHLQAIAWDGMTAANPVEMHDATLQRASTIDRYQTRFLLKGTVLKGAVEVPKEMSDEQLEVMKNFLRRNFTGPDANDDMIVLPDGAKVSNTTIPPLQAQLLEQGAASTKQIAQITGVDPAFLYERSDTKYSGITEAGESVVRYTFRPWIHQIEAELTLKLLTAADRAKGLRVEMDPDALLRGDAKAQTETAKARTDAGLTTKNEGRVYLGYPKSTDPEADKLKTLGDTAPPKPAA